MLRISGERGSWTGVAPGRGLSTKGGMRSSSRAATTTSPRSSRTWTGPATSTLTAGRCTSSPLRRGVRKLRPHRPGQRAGAGRLHPRAAVGRRDRHGEYVVEGRWHLMGAPPPKPPEPKGPTRKLYDYIAVCQIFASQPPVQVMESIAESLGDNDPPLTGAS